MKHTHRSQRIFALLLALVMVMSMLPARAFAAEATIVGSSETVELGNPADLEGLVSYEMIRDYTVKAGTVPTLDTAITGTLADETTIEGVITWDEISEEIYTVAGDYTITGIASFEGFDDIAVTASLHVIPNVAALRNVSAATMEGTLPTLPSFVSGVLADGTLAGTFAVEWDAPEASAYAVVGEIVTVTGTAVVFGDETLDVTCAVRVAEAVNTESVNVAPMVETLSQDVPAGYESDVLTSINNGVLKPGDNTSERWTNWNYRTYSDNATLTLTWAAAQMVSSVNLYYYYDNCCAYPEALEFSCSLDGQEYTVIGHTAEQIETYYLGEMWTYTFDEPINPVGLKVKLTQQGGTSGAHCVGLTELEVMTYAAPMELQSGAQLAGIFVDGTAIEGFDPAVYTYEIADGVITAEATENVGITILPACENIVRILTVSEDGASANVYELTIAEKACGHEETTVIPGVEATCTETGLTEGTECAVCGEILVAQEEIPALGHTEEVIPGTPATFDEAGMTEGVKCSVCGEILVAQETIPMLDYNEGIVPLNTLIVSCGDYELNGGASEGPAELAVDDDLDTIWHTNWYGTSRDNHWIQFELTEDYEVDGLRYKPRVAGNTNGIITQYDVQVSDDGESFRSVASGNWEGDRTWKVAQFDTENVKYVRLVALDALTDNDYVFACAAEIRLTGEKFDAGTHEHSYTAVVTEPTCTEGGYTTYTCSCGDSYIADETPALGHTEGEAVIENEVAATCTEAGSYDSVVYCSVCGEEISRETITVPALGHTEGEAVKENEKAATCTEDGSYDSVIYCSVCNEEISRETVAVPALGHTEEVIPGKDATCTENGLTEGKKCAVCGEILVAQEEIAALGHTPAEPVIENEVAATCTEDGSYDSVVYCSVCSEEISRETVTVPALGHTEEVIPGKDATCTEPGLTEGKKCSVCNEILVAQVEIPALGHSWSGGHCEHCGEARPNPFVDVPEKEFYFEPVLWAVESGITNGVDATHFGPMENCNRAQAVTFLWRAAGSPAPVNAENPFVDVNENDWFYAPVLWAVEKGITNGVDATHFDPNKACNRAQIVTFLYRAMGSPATVSRTDPFVDVAESDFFYKPVLWAVENGITQGINAITFGPSQNCNRAQIVTFLYRAYVK